MTKSKGVNAPRFKPTPAELQFLAERFPNTQTQVLANVFGVHYGQISGLAKRMGWKKSEAFLSGKDGGRLDGTRGASCRFTKGCVPPNKGKKMPGHGNPATQYKPGQRPFNEAPIGSYRVNADGYAEFKYSDEPGPYTKRWIPVHRKVWIEANGPIPKGHVIAFRPGMKTTDPAAITLDAIECITLRENMLRNTLHRFGPEVAQLVQLRGAITRQINKRQKAQEQDYEQEPQ
jgi:HNH endonuclease